MRRLLIWIRQVPLVNYAGRLLLQAMRRYARLLESRLIPSWPVVGVVPARMAGHDVLLSASTSNRLVSALYWQGDQIEANEMLLVSTLAPSLRVLLDVGANMGAVSLLAAKVNPQLRGLAFEPYRPNYECLVRHLELNGIGEIKARQVALSDAAGSLTLYVPQAGHTSDVVSAVNPAFMEAMYREAYQPETVEVITLDTAVAQAGLPTVDFIKLDVEGLELQVLRGAEHTIRLHRPLLMVELFCVEDYEERVPNVRGKMEGRRPEAIIEQLFAWGYSAYLICSMGLYRVNDPPYPDFGNTLFAPRQSSQRFLPYRLGAEALWTELHG